MEALPIIISCAALAAVVVLGLLIWSRLKELAAKPASDGIQIMQQQVDSLRQQTQGSLENMNASLLKTLTALQEALSKQTKAVTDGLSSQMASLQQQTQVFADFKQRVGQVETLSQNLDTLGKEISNFQKILQAPKLRGSMGEFMLEELLGQILPAECYATQFAFPGSTEKVDAIIMLQNGTVPVDAKFPLDSFRRIMDLQAGSEEQKRGLKDFRKAVKKHIDDIAAKYIRPDAGTLDIAFMYIPAENVFYEIILRDVNEENVNDPEESISHYAQDKRVIPVSPNSFWAYLRIIAMGLTGLRLEQNVKQVRDQLRGMCKDIDEFEKDFKTLGAHLDHAYSKYLEAAPKFSSMSMTLKIIADVRALEKVEPTLPFQDQAGTNALPG